MRKKGRERKGKGREIVEERERDRKEKEQKRRKGKENPHWEPPVTSQALSSVQWQVPFPYATTVSSMARTHEDKVRTWT